MTRRKLISKIRRLGRKEKVAVRFDERRGKGSHGTLYYGDRYSTVPKGELKTGTLDGILENLGLMIDDI